MGEVACIIEADVAEFLILSEAVVVLHLAQHHAELCEEEETVLDAGEAKTPTP